MPRICLLLGVLLVCMYHGKLRCMTFDRPSGSEPECYNYTCITLEEHFDPLAIQSESTNEVFDLLVQALPPQAGEIVVGSNVTAGNLKA